MPVGEKESRREKQKSGWKFISLLVYYLLVQTKVVWSGKRL